jgi:hypothetical protein
MRFQVCGRNAYQGYGVRRVEWVSYDRVVPELLDIAIFYHSREIAKLSLRKFKDVVIALILRNETVDRVGAKVTCRTLNER